MPSSRAREVARAAASAFGGRPEVRRIWDHARSSHVDVLHADDRPNRGWVSYSTVTLSEWENLLDGQDVRVELAGIAARNQVKFAELLAAAALKVMKDRWLAAPGVVFPELTSQSGLSHNLPHVVWTPPFPWEQLGSVEVAGGPSVHWLVAVPISERERQYLLESGYDALERKLAKASAEFIDLERGSVV